MRRRYISLVVVIVACMFFVIGCANSNISSEAEPDNSTESTKEPVDNESDEGNEGTSELTTVTVAYQPNMGGASAIAVGQEMGFFEQAGLKLDLVLFQTGPEEIGALANGKLDFGFVGTGPMFMLMEGMGKLITIDKFNLDNAIIVSKESGIKEISDLKGQKVMVPLGTTAHVSLYELLKTANLTLNDIEELNANPSQQVAGFASGNAEVIAGWSPTTDLALEKREGASVLADDYDLDAEVALPSGWAASNNLVENDPELVKRFLWAILKSMDYREKNIDEAIKWVTELTEVSEELNRSSAEKSKWPVSDEMVEQFQDGTAQAWLDNLAKGFVEMGRLDSVPEYSSYTTADLLKEASELDFE